MRWRRVSFQGGGGGGGVWVGGVDGLEWEGSEELGHSLSIIPMLLAC